MQTALDRPRTARNTRVGRTDKTSAAVAKTKPHAPPRKADDKTLRLIEAIKGLKGLR